MSEPQDTTHATAQDTAQGPVDPQGGGDLDAAPPPGGPQRTDSPDAPGAPFGTPPGEHESELPDADDADDAHDAAAGSALQEENAERALDQPSDGSGEE
ncbi:MAG TPA: hypothetical protein VD864_05720 [Nocardioides sp.]|nr:hypothetical protein [Nocardioides sp.]